VLPFLGPTTVRDGLALPVDFAGDLWTYVRPVKLRNTGSVVRVIDSRASVLNASNLIEDAALDRYEFIRDAYLQRRANKIDDGYNPAPEKGGKDTGGKEDGKPKSDKSSAIEPADQAVRQAAVGQAQEPAAGSAIQLTSSAGGNAGNGANLPQIHTEAVSIQRAPTSELPV
jgi:phospholipid-binding lipoprotein MlaA